jgi:hypothetical protein
MRARPLSAVAATTTTLLALTFVLTSAGGCLELGLGPTDGGTTASDAGTDADASGIQTADCFQDKLSGIVLCRATSLCPTVYVDETLYPDCGFRVTGNTAQLLCLCNGEQLCPGVAAVRCTDFATFLNQNSELSVCSRVADGLCSSIR